MITGSELVAKLPSINQRLDVWTVAVGLGGTAMTLLNIKNSTEDVDFILEEGDTTEFAIIARDVCGTNVDVFGRCNAYSTQMPDDYVYRSTKIVSFDKMDVYAMDLLDVVLTKMARGESRDYDDSRLCLKFGAYDKSKIVKRMQDYSPDSTMQANVDNLIGRYL